MYEKPVTMKDWFRSIRDIEARIRAMDDIKRALLGDHDAAKRLTERGELLPCPYCKNESVIHEVEAIAKYAEYKKEVPKNARIIRCISYVNGKKNHWEYREKEYVPQCVDTTCCGRATKRYKSKQEAIKAWNTRAPILTPEELKKLEESL